MRFLLILFAFLVSCQPYEMPQIEGTYIVNDEVRWTLHEDGSFDEQHLTQFIGGCGQWSFSEGDFVLLGSIYNNHHKMTGTLSYWEQGWIFREHDGRIFEMDRNE